MVRLEMNNYNIALTEKQQKYQHYHPEKYEYLAGEEIETFNQKQIKEQIKFSYSSLGKAF